MKNIFLLLGVLLGLFSCETQQKEIHSGISSPYFDGTMMDYLRSSDFNWELTVQMIERAGLMDLFEGKVDTLPEITFWAPTSYSILNYLWDHQLEEVSELSELECRQLILKHIVKGKYLKKDVAFINPAYYVNDKEQDGGTNLVCLAGNRVRAYLEKSSYGGVPEAGPVTLFLWSLSEGKRVPMASPDIQPKNGVVHALNYTYLFGKI